MKRKIFSSINTENATEEKPIWTKKELLSLQPRIGATTLNTVELKNVLKYLGQLLELRESGLFPDAVNTQFHFTFCITYYADGSGLMCNVLYSDNEHYNFRIDEDKLHTRFDRDIDLIYAYHNLRDDIIQDIIDNQ